jgi:hypothetical protein
VPAERLLGPPPTETPECESSTCAGISVHDPVHAHDDWWNWVGLASIVLITLFAAGFMVARVLPA